MGIRVQLENPLIISYNPPLRFHTDMLDFLHRISPCKNPPALRVTFLTWLQLAGHMGRVCAHCVHCAVGWSDFEIFFLTVVL